MTDRHFQVRGGGDRKEILNDDGWTYLTACGTYVSAHLFESTYLKKTVSCLGCIMVLFEMQSRGLNLKYYKAWEHG